MTDKKIPDLNDVRVHLADDASDAILEFITETDSVNYTITQDLLMKLLGRLGDLNASWESKREEIDPTAGKAGEIRPMTAIRATAFSTASIPNTEEGAVIFQTVTGPQSFALPKAAMVLLGQSLVREAERDPKLPRQN